MIPAWKVQAIVALLADDALSQRAIAKRLQVGRGVVASIANGTRPDYGALRLAQAPPPPAAPQPTERCPECGAMVELPCLACRARRTMVYHRLPPLDLLPVSEALQLKLLDAEQIRYEEIRARRRSLLGTKNHQRSRTMAVPCIFRGPERRPR
jgi:hypothetical protein